MEHPQDAYTHPEHARNAVLEGHFLKKMDKCTKMIPFFFWMKILKEDNEDYS